MTVRLIGGPAVLVEVGGLRLLADLVADQPGSRTTGVAVDEVGPIDAVLLSNDQHGSRLGPSGRVVLERAPLVLTTPDCAARLGGCARGLPPWYHLSLTCSGGGAVRITGVPTQPGPDEAVRHIGFVLSGVDIPTSYLSAANAPLDVVREIARRCAPIDIALLATGRSLVDPVGEQAARVAVTLGCATVIPIHIEDRDRHPDNVEDIRAAFIRHGIGEHLCALTVGETATF
jgi:L-ascorbate metabolism protein UlaG (beta-lactamase superfamily)